ncbi:MAG: hypothetical protein SOZ01_09195 [Selenomonadaceae bacterium]|nr:hypothetical protein [Selenomonadaceae bacterium]MDY3916893.1 hypothetical protein [Selenomonadaceae bacterium]
MAVSIEDLINRKDEIQKVKKQQYDLKTSIGTITVKLPRRTIVIEANKLEGPGDADRYLLLNTIVEPDLHSHKLQEAYGCGEPTDIVDALFAPGEVVAISQKIMKLAGYGKDIQSEVHTVAKN